MSKNQKNYWYYAEHACALEQKGNKGCVEVWQKAAELAQSETNRFYALQRAEYSRRWLCQKKEVDGETSIYQDVRAILREFNVTGIKTFELKKAVSAAQSKGYLTRYPEIS